MYEYKVGLVVGKFSPLHNGHDYVIRTALSQCEKVILLSYCNPVLDVSTGLRKLWLEQYGDRAIVIVPTGTVPYDTDAEVVHRNFCALMCEINSPLSLPDVVFGSETYIEPFAEHLGRRWNKDVDYSVVDIDRRMFPTSGTACRADMAAADESFLPEFVSKTRTRKVLILGGESAGKTTLCQALNKATGYPWVPEYGRQFCEEIGGVDNLKYEDMVRIGRMQAAKESVWMNATTSPYLFCDTSPLTTLFYSSFLFGKIDPTLKHLSERQYDYVFILKMHKFVQDGDRFSPDFSNRQYKWYCDYYDRNPGHSKIRILNGTLEDRVIQVLGELPHRQTPITGIY